MIDKIYKLILVSFIFCLFALEVKTAYEPFEIDAIKVTNSLAADVNTATVTQFNNINTTAVINSDTDVFTSVDSDGVNCVAGTYLVDVILYRTSNNPSNGPRTNVGVEITVDGVGTGSVGADGYIRSPNDGAPSGHEEASTSVSDVVVLSSVGKIGFTTIQLASANTEPAPAGQSILRIVRVDD
jgi:hypothetical protein